MSKKLKLFLLLTAAYIGIALVFTFPLILHFKDFYAGGSEDGAAMVWNFWWMKYSIFELGQNPLVCKYLYFPDGVNLTFYTMPKLLGMISIPFQAFLPLAVSYNIIYLLTAVGTALATYWLVYYLLGERAPAFMAGVFFAFSPFRFGQHSHMFMLATMLLPVFILLLLKAKQDIYEGDKRGWYLFAAAGIILGLVSYDTEHYTIFLMMFALLYLIFCLPASWHGGRLRKWLSLALGLLIIAAVSAAVYSPVIYESYRVSTDEGSFINFQLWEISRYGADAVSFFLPYKDSVFLGSMFESITGRLDVFPEVTYMGISTLLLSAIGLWAYRKYSWVWFWCLTAVVFALFALGPFIKIYGRSSSIPGPYFLYSFLPVLKGMRTPPRFASLVALAVAVLAACGVSALIKYINRRNWGNIVTGLIVAVFLIVFFVDVWPTSMITSLKVPDIYREIAKSNISGSVLPIPLGWEAPNAGIAGKETTSMELYQTVHERPILGGMVSRIAPEEVYRGVHTPVIDYLSDPEKLDPSALDKDPDTIIQVMSRYQVAFVVVQKHLPEVIYQREMITPSTDLSRETIAELDGYLTTYLSMEKIEENEDLVAYRRR